MKSVSFRSVFASLVFVAACGGDDKRPETPPPSVPSAAPMDSAPVGSASAAPPAASSAAPAASSSAPMTPPPAKGKFLSGALGAKSGQVDKVGTKDGAYAPDGVKDIVFEAELDGPAMAIAVMSVDDKGEPNGAFSADTYVGTQPIPPEVSSVLKQGKTTAGVAIYENDKVVNKKDGSLAPLAAGKHKLVIHVSLKDAPKGAYKVVAVFDDYTTAATNPITVK
ncbi:MAG: hypothetical protein U0270_31510 [Labilithrix sp.]